jgi:hypothetical protein
MGNNEVRKSKEVYKWVKWQNTDANRKWLRKEWDINETELFWTLHKEKIICFKAWDYL